MYTMYIMYSQSFNASHEPKASLTRQKLVHMSILLTFAFRSKRHLIKQYFRLKNLTKTNTPLAVVKTKRTAISLRSVYSFAAIKTTILTCICAWPQAFFDGSKNCRPNRPALAIVSQLT